MKIRKKTTKTQRFIIFFVIFVIFVSLWFSLSVFSLELRAETVKAAHVEAELVSEVESIQPGQPFWVALRLKMEEHWHTYWQNPGDSGLATKIAWNLPEGFRAEPIQWPFPEKIEDPPLVSFGYYGEVYLLVKIHPPASLPVEKPVTLAATGNWLVCKEICLPGRAQLKIELPIKNEVPRVNPKWADGFAASRAKLPLESSDWKISAAIKNDLIVISTIAPKEYRGELSSLLFFPAQGGIIDYASEQKLKKTTDGYMIELKRSEFSTELPTSLKGILFSPQGWRGAGSEKALIVDVPLK
jgi:DsbC/DsbD-like thiol-disulfide interchange protein